MSLAPLGDRWLRRIARTTGLHVVRGSTSCGYTHRFITADGHAGWFDVKEYRRDPTSPKVWGLHPEREAGQRRNDDGTYWVDGRQVTEAEYVAAERDAGFRDPFGRPGEPATSSWSGIGSDGVRHSGHLGSVLVDPDEDEREG